MLHLKESSRGVVGPLRFNMFFLKAHTIGAEHDGASLSFLSYCVKWVALLDPWPCRRAWAGSGACYRFAAFFRFSTRPRWRRHSFSRRPPRETLAIAEALQSPCQARNCEDDIPLLVRALEHYAAYLEATKRPGRPIPGPCGRVEEKAATGGERQAGEVS